LGVVPRGESVDIPLKAMNALSYSIYVLVTRVLSKLF
jgi:hypothetical protein